MILAVGGTDSSGGAGLEQDRRVAESLGCPLRTAVTAVTAQGKKGVLAVEPVSNSLLKKQLELHMAEERPLAVKLGALFKGEQIGLIRDFFEDWTQIRSDFLVLADPVFAPSGGRPFLPEKERDAYKVLLDYVDVITPNRSELEILSGRNVSSVDEGEAAAAELASRHDLIVVLTGGHFPGNRLVEKVVSPGSCRTFRKRREQLARTHGTGCALATALTVFLIQGYPMEKAFPRATRAVSRIMGEEI